MNLDSNAISGRVGHSNIFKKWEKFDYRKLTSLYLRKIKIQWLKIL